MAIYFETIEGKRWIPDSYLLVGLDETGHEDPSIPHHPVFGLGGCAIPVRDYPDLIRTPWRQLKAAMFGSADFPLHASELHTPSQEQLAALEAFFKQTGFGRIAVLTSVRTVVSESVPDYQLAARGVLERIARLVSHFGCDGAVLVHEEASRTDHLAAAYLDGYSLTLTDGSDSSVLPFLKYRLRKAAQEPLLEVADFIMHAAGGQVRTALAGRPWGKRKDFQAVFGGQPTPLVQFFQILHADVAPQSA